MYLYAISIKLTLCVMSLSPIISSTALPKHKVVWSENLSKRSGPNTVHGARLQVDQDGSGHIFATAGLCVVYINSL